MLRRRDLDIQKASAPAIAKSVEEESLIGPDDLFDGAYKFSRGVRIQGRVEGSIESRGHVIIEEQAQVKGDIVAREVTVAGRYDGKARCRGCFHITSGAIVTGEINTNVLIVEEGGYFDGEFKMSERLVFGYTSD